MFSIDYDRQGDVLRTLTSRLIEFGPFKDSKDLSLRKYENAKESGFLYRARDYTRWPGEMKVIIKDNGICRAELSGNFFPVDPEKQDALKKRIRRAVHGLNKKIKRGG